MKLSQEQLDVLRYIAERMKAGRMLVVTASVSGEDVAATLDTDIYISSGFPVADFEQVLDKAEAEFNKAAEKAELEFNKV